MVHISSTVLKIQSDHKMLPKGGPWKFFNSGKGHWNPWSYMPTCQSHLLRCSWNMSNLSFTKYRQCIKGKMSKIKSRFKKQTSC